MADEHGAASAPASMVTTGMSLPPAFEPGPPARALSAAMPVMVSVRTVVVRSGTAILRAAAFWIPIAVASATISAYR